MSLGGLALQFFLQVAVILLVCQVVGVFVRRLRQPQVIAEMIAGVLLGPSLLGWVCPEWQAAMFPTASTDPARNSQVYLYPVAQMGLALYMFLVGMDLRWELVRAKWAPAMAVSITGMLAPFCLGAGLGWYYHASASASVAGLFPERTQLSEAMLFMGASLCITAFPMLARIIEFKGLNGTTIGTVSIGAGAVNDALAWCVLAVVLASMDRDPQQAILKIGGGLAFVLVAWCVLRPALRWLEPRVLVRSGTVTESGLTLLLAGMALAAWFTELVGLHVVLGAFVMGAITPRGPLTEQVTQKLQPLTTTLLLPLFFAYSGLNTKLGLLISPSLLSVCVWVLVAAVAGKGVACWGAARLTGLSQRESLGIGTLMNARGLMELIIINIGLERGVITESCFAVLVVMALATTLMTSPLFDWLASDA